MTVRLLARLFAGLVLLSALLSAAQDATVRLKVLTTGGKQMDITAPGSSSWRFECGDVRINVRPSEVARVDRAEGGFRITLADGTTLQATHTGTDALAGEGEWGRTRLEWATIQQVEVGVEKPAPPPSSPSKPSPAQWQVTPAAGPTVTLSSLDWDTSWKTADGVEYSVTSEYLGEVERIAGTGNYRMKFGDGSLLEAAPLRPQRVTAACAWGQVSIDVVRIVRIVRTPPPPGPVPSKEAAPRTDIRLRSGWQFSMIDVDGAWEFRLGEFAARVDAGKVRTLKAGPEAGRMVVNEAAEWNLALPSRPKDSPAMLGGTCAIGRIRIPWEQIAELKTGKPSAARATPLVTLVSTSGVSLGATETTFSAAELGSWTVESVRWANVQSADLESGGLLLKGPRDTTLRLKTDKATLNGTWALGSFSIPFASIARVQPTAKPAAGAAAAPPKTVAITSGPGFVLDVLEVQWPDVDSRTTWLREFTELPTGPYRLWIRKGAVLNEGFERGSDGLTVTVLGRKYPVGKSSEKVTLVTTLATVKAELGNLASLTPVARSAAPAAGRIDAAIRRADSQEDVCKTTGAVFVNYPTRGWTGTYLVSQWPFQWWRSETITVQREDDQARIDIALDKLRRIDIVGARYDRKLLLQSIAGSEMRVTHVATGLNETSRHGPSEWERDKEGVVLTLSADAYLFVPFSGITAVSFTRPPATGAVKR
jgi:hypothetical protein